MPTTVLYMRKSYDTCQSLLFGCCFQRPLCLLSSGSPVSRGVSGCELWYRTESVTDDLHADYHYRDFSGDTTRLLYLRDGVWKEFRQQKSHIRTYNFHPALNLSVTHPDTAKISRLRRSDLSQCTIVGVFGPRSSGLTSDKFYERS